MLDQESPLRVTGAQMLFPAEEKDIASIATLEIGYRTCLNKILSLANVKQELSNVEMTFEEGSQPKQ
jgi:hypothetical protein